MMIPWVGVVAIPYFVLAYPPSRQTYALMFYKKRMARRRRWIIIIDIKSGLPNVVFFSMRFELKFIENGERDKWATR